MWENFRHFEEREILLYYCSLNYLPMSEKLFHVHIMTNSSHTTFYTGVTSNLIQRVTQHREKVDPTSFTVKYNCFKLIYFEN